MGSDGKTPTGDQSINMTQAEKVQAAGGNKASQSVLHETLESYTALKTGNGIHTVGTPEGDTTYLKAHKEVMSLDQSYSDQGFHYDSKTVPGTKFIFYENPTTHKQVVLYGVKLTPIVSN